MSESHSSLESPEQTSLAVWSASFLDALITANRNTAREYAQRMSSRQADWLIGQALAPYVYYQLQAVDLLSELPADSRSVLQRSYYMITAQNALYSAELISLLADLQLEHIDPIVLKGMVLGNTIYPSPATRPVSDLDLLIDPTDIETVRRIFSKRGYHTTGLNLDHPQEIDSAMSGWREYPDGQRLAVEAHWRLFHESAYQFIDLAWIHLASNAITLNNIHMRALSPVDQLIHACGHLLVHHSQTWLALWLLDLRLMVEHYGRDWDWVNVTRRATQAQLAGAVRYWLQLAECWCGPFIPASAKVAFQSALTTSEERRYLALANGPRLYVWQLILHRARGTGSLRRSIIYMARLFFPPWPYMQYHYHARTRWLAPLYYIWRLIRAGLIAFRRRGLMKFDA
jgi:putative nucleotidyltransferase-like protein